MCISALPWSIVLDDFKFWAGVAASIFGFLATQIISYIKMKDKLLQVEDDINGVGRNFRSFSNVVERNHLELAQRIAKIEGYLEIRYRNAGPVTHPTKE
jgi:hypothetical protein